MGLFVPKHVELYRQELPGYEKGNHRNGAFSFPDGLFIIVSDGMGWEHVSVSRKSRMPSYEDLTRAKEIFWDEEDCAMQLFVPKSQHINCHQYCLHLWRPLEDDIPMPPGIMVGPSGG